MLKPKLRALLDKHLIINQAKQIHGVILTNGLRDLEPPLLLRLLLSAKSHGGSTLQYVKSMVQHMHKSDTFCFGSAIRILTENSQFGEAISLYVRFQSLGIGSPSTFAISSAVKSCSRIRDVVSGSCLHAQSWKYGFCGDVYVQTSLVDFYSKMGRMGCARKVFDGMPVRNVVSWNSILSGYVKSGDMETARVVFDEIPERDVVSWNSMVSGYAGVGNMESAYELFVKMPERSCASWNAMISGYIQCGKIDLARSFFDSMDKRKNQITFTAMISGYSKSGDVESARKLFHEISDEKEHIVYNAMISTYAQNGRPEEALKLFDEMLESKLQPDYMTLASAISACSQLGDLKSGSWIESYMKEQGIQMDDHLATAFLDLYAKCGITEKAYALFLGLQNKDVTAYTAMILGFGINGKANDAIKLFNAMISSEIKPNLATVTAILTAYSHMGLVEEGYRFFRCMEERYGLSPTVDHYGIVVGLLGRAGRLEEAYGLIKGMTMEAHVGVWGALLHGCSLHCNLEIGEEAARHCLGVENGGGYRSLLANVYASVGRWDDAERLRQSVNGNEWFAKLAGSSRTEDDE
ncbi:unnamed protein product [Cuscuta campestris]|uniref:Pentacotripeptide-repeat region of PRORP domain-containing protein n=1 Tax=Cuscuta campestris TaxID=132261 RepID=A0A484LZ78_9ASTE|nr:unnamed protein product [Cuscuta campestris]